MGQHHIANHGKLRGRLQGVFTVVVAGGPRLGDLRAGTMAATTGFTVAWSGAAAVCIGVVLVSALAVRSFWRYDASQWGTAGLLPDQHSAANGHCETIKCSDHWQRCHALAR